MCIDDRTTFYKRMFTSTEHRWAYVLKWPTGVNDWKLAAILDFNAWMFLGYILHKRETAQWMFNGSYSFATESKHVEGKMFLRNWIQWLSLIRKGNSPSKRCRKITRYVACYDPTSKCVILS